MHTTSDWNQQDEMRVMPEKVFNVLEEFNDKDHRYFWRVPDRVGNVFFDIISGFKEHRRNFGLWKIFGSRYTRLTLKKLEHKFLGAVFDKFSFQ